ncbi:MAG: ABC transporter ATP-binding protein [Planctomycetes bacterium]|nr:ABC transporter ATP-binding protein [Planctomycetota bacterium]
MQHTDGPLVLVRGLRTRFNTDEGCVQAVDDVSFRIEKGQTFALVGESGCGKSVTALSLMRLIPSPPGEITDGQILLAGRDLLSLSEKQMQRVRGKDVAMIFQEPMTSLNPVYTVGSQIVEAIRLHQGLGSRQAWALAAEMLARVGIPEPAQRVREYPHQMSGGMRQRVMIAMAISCNPRLLIADEPTTALDVTIQAQILDLLNELKTSAGLSILLITHDLGVVAESADAVGVMYAGRMVEQAAVGPLFGEPLHPYTQGLFRSLPRLGRTHKRLETIEGMVPNPLHFPSGCKFHPRCPIGRDLERCRTQEPELREVKDGHWAACWECPGYAGARATDPTATVMKGTRQDG